MESVLKQVKDFHQAMRLPFSETPAADIPEELFMLRNELLREENEEYLDACKQKDIVKIADALGDILYVLCGTIVTHGLQDKMAAIMDEIHASNMSKLDENGNPIYREDGKILKSDRFFRPDLHKIFSGE